MMKEENRKAVALNDDDLDAVSGGLKRTCSHILTITNEEPTIETGRPTPTLIQPDIPEETGRPTPTLKQ